MAVRSVPRSAVPLLLAAMAIFVITVVIGILNGLDIWEVAHGPLLAHVHAGTLGWITLAVFAGGAWVLGAELPKAFVWIAVVAVVAYVVAFYLNLSQLRPGVGTVMLAVMVWFAVWAFRARTGKPMTVPTLGVLLASISLIIGGLLGVILGLMLSGMMEVNVGFVSGHPAMMVAGYLVLAGVAFAEQLLGGAGTEGTSKPGIAQQVLLFVAGIVLAVGFLANVEPLLGVATMLQIVGTVFVLGRLGKLLMGSKAATPGCYGATAVVFLVPAVFLVLYLVIAFASKGLEPPANLLLTMDHIVFIGVLTNVIFGMLVLAGDARREVMAWADQFIYWGMNAGLLLFAAGLLMETAMLKRIGTPIMGAAILLGLATFATRLAGGRADQPDEVAGSV